MIILAVVITHHTGGSALGGNGMAAHRVDLRDKRYAHRWVGLDRGDGRPQPGASSTHNRYVEF
jgi:hypothetical protein